MKSERVVSNPENHGWEEVNGKWIWASGRNTGHIVDGDTEGQIATWHDPANAWTPQSAVVVSGGNVGIGNTGPTRTLDIGDGTASANAEINSSSAPNFLFSRADVEVGYIGTTLWNTGSGSDTEMSIRGASAITFAIGSTEKMRIDSTGNLLIGKTSTDFSTEGIALYSSSDANGSRVNITNTANKVVNLNRKSDNGIILQFYKDGSSVGSISTNANSLPSDRNFKKNIKDLQLGLGFVSALNPVTYNYKMDDESDPVMTGLIAQDVEETLKEFGVEPNSMTLLQYNPVEDKKESDYQMDYSKLIPVLTKAIQELSGQVDELKAEVAALKGA